MQPGFRPLVSKWSCRLDGDRFGNSSTVVGFDIYVRLQFSKWLPYSRRMFNLRLFSKENRVIWCTCYLYQNLNWQIYVFMERASCVMFLNLFLHWRKYCDVISYPCFVLHKTLLNIKTGPKGRLSLAHLHGKEWNILSSLRNLYKSIAKSPPLFLLEIESISSSILKKYILSFLKDQKDYFRISTKYYSFLSDSFFLVCVKES